MKSGHCAGYSIMFASNVDRLLLFTGDNERGSVYGGAVWPSQHAGRVGNPGLDTDRYGWWFWRAGLVFDRQGIARYAKAI